MATLVRWEPYRNMLSTRRMMDQMFNEMFRSIDNQQSSDGQNSGNLEIDINESEEQYTIQASMPGVKAEDIDISVNGDMLTISGETESESESDKGHYHLRERHYGSFRRSIALPSNVDADNIDAECENGVLKLKLPKSEETKPRRISVKGSNGSKTIEGQSSNSGSQKK